MFPFAHLFLRPASACGSHFVAVMSYLSLCFAIPLQVGAVQEWNQLGDGDWFVGSNWTPAGVPTVTESAQINNGGHAMASSGGPVTAFLIDVGKNGGSGALTVTGPDVMVQGSLDLGDVESTFAVGPVNVTSSGQATFSDNTSLSFGIGGVGDINVGQTSAGLGATANGSAYSFH